MGTVFPQRGIVSSGRILPYVLLAGTGAVALFAALFLFSGEETTSPEESTSVPVSTPAAEFLDGSSWTTYQSEEYGFSIDHPSHWEVRVSRDALTPAIHIFDPATAVGAVFPLTHFSEVTHVSLYPRGIPTEGVFSNTRESSVTFREPVRAANDFLLEDGSVWATAASFSGAQPEGWDEAGFVWAKVVMENLDLTCTRGAEEVPVDLCDPFSGDTLLRRGTVPSAVRAIEERMLASLRFFDRAAGHASGGGGGSGAADFSELIRVTSPAPGAAIASPLTIRGEARGEWYFEATFPVVLVNGEGYTIAEHYAEATSDWMSEDFVPFEATFEFAAPKTAVSDHGVLILRKSNPSGLPEHDAAIEIPVRFGQ